MADRDDHRADDHLAREVAAALAPLLEEWRRALEGLSAAVGGAEGLRSAMDARDAERASWEAGHPGLRYGQCCHCLCQARHPDRMGVCATHAVTFEVRVFEGDPLQVPLCRACAELTADQHGQVSG